MIWIRWCGGRFRCYFAKWRWWGGRFRLNFAEWSGGGMAEVVRGPEGRLAGLKIWVNCSNLLAADLFLVDFEVLFPLLNPMFSLTKQGRGGAGSPLLPVELPTDSITKQGGGGALVRHSSDKNELLCDCRLSNQLFRILDLTEEYSSLLEWEQNSPDPSL